MNYYSCFGEMVEANGMILPEEITFQFRFTKYNLGILEIIDNKKPFFESCPYEILDNHIQKVKISDSSFEYSLAVYKNFTFNESGYFYVVSIWDDCLWLPSSFIERKALKVFAGDIVRFNNHLEPPLPFMKALLKKLKTFYYQKKYQFNNWLKS